MGSAKARITMLVMHGDDDQIVPIAASAGTLPETAEERHDEGLWGYPHGMLHHAHMINRDLLTFING